MDKDFILFLLNLIETASNDSSDDDDVTELIHFILVYNLQFKNCPESENITIKALEEAENPKIFSETLLFLFNRKSKWNYLVFIILIFFKLFYIKKNTWIFC